MNRREFLRLSGALVVGAVVGGVDARDAEDRAIRLARLAQDHQDELYAIDVEAMVNLREMEIRAHGLEEVQRRDQELEALWDKFMGHLEGMGLA